MKECPVCHKVGFHKISCSTQKVTVFLSKADITNGMRAEVNVKTDEKNPKD